MTCSGCLFERIRSRRVSPVHAADLFSNFADLQTFRRCEKDASADGEPKEMGEVCPHTPAFSRDTNAADKRRNVRILRHALKRNSRRMVLRRSCKEFLKTPQESLDLHIHQANASFSFGLPVGLTDTIGLCSAEGTRSPLPLTEEPRLVYSNSCKTAAGPAQMWDLASPDHFRMPSEANSGTEIHRTSGFWPKTKGVWEIAE